MNDGYKSFFLDVSDGHSLFVESAGTGIPVVFLHGGPGGSYPEQIKDFFPQNKWFSILFDQRGAGRSKPFAGLENNNTQTLIEDLEAIRKHFAIDKWVVFGGSWGSTLALAYAQAHPEHVKALVLRGIFLCRDQDITWFYRHGASMIFPEAWEKYKKVVDLYGENGEDPVDCYYRLLTGTDKKIAQIAAEAWSSWEARCSTLHPNKDLVKSMGSGDQALALARIETHYFANDCFMEQNQLLKNIEKIQHIPGLIVHGRYDVVCPVENAFRLKNSWNKAELKIVADAGHSLYEPGITSVVTQYMSNFND